jgi:outer membrane protein assembly factor BamB
MFLVFIRFWQQHRRPSLVGLVFVGSLAPALACPFAPGGSDLTGQNAYWNAPTATPRPTLPPIPTTCVQVVPTPGCPLCTPELVFIVTTSGLITCCDAKDGKLIWQQDLEVEIKSSPSLVGSRVYLLDTKGVMHIFEAGRAFKEIAKFPLGDEVYASPAFVGGRIYIRGKQNLYCIGPKS